MMIMVMLMIIMIIGFIDTYSEVPLKPALIGLLS